MESHSPKTHHHHPSPPQTPIPRPDPYPTTFVQADTTSFKKVVQMLTGSSNPTRNPIPPIRNPTKKPSKLYERRNSMKNFKISPLTPGFSSGLSDSPRRPGTPGILNFPALVISPVTPLVPDPFVTRSPGGLNVAAEDKAIAQKGYYLHPSPVGTPNRDSEPRLLPLFPVTSPRVSGSS